MKLEPQIDLDALRATYEVEDCIAAKNRTMAVRVAYKNDPPTMIRMCGVYKMSNEELVDLGPHALMEMANNDIKKKLRELNGEGLEPGQPIPEHIHDGRLEFGVETLP